MYSYGPPHMANQKQYDQLEHTYSNYVMIRDVTLKTCQRRWMIGRRGERGSGISVLAARHDNDDDEHSMYVSHSSVSAYDTYSYEIPKLFVSIFSIFDSFHFLNCLMIVVLEKYPWNLGPMCKFYELNIYISNICFSL